MLDMVKNIQGENRSTALAIRCKAHSNVLLQQPILIRSKPSPNQGEGDTTIDPCTVFFKKESGVENQSLNYDKLYCGEHPPKTDASEEEKEKDAFYNK